MEITNLSRGLWSRRSTGASDGILWGRRWERVNSGLPGAVVKVSVFQWGSIGG